MVIKKFIIQTFCLAVIAALFSMSFIEAPACITKLFLGVDFTKPIKKLHDKIAADPDFKIFSSDSIYKADHFFSAKYLKTDHVYTNPDSIHICVGVLKDADKVTHARPRDAKSVKIKVFLKDTAATDLEYNNIQRIICKQIDFKNQFAKGNGGKVVTGDGSLYFFTQEVFPLLEFHKVKEIYKQGNTSMQRSVIVLEYISNDL